MLICVSFDMNSGRHDLVAGLVTTPNISLVTFISNSCNPRSMSSDKPVISASVLSALEEISEVQSETFEIPNSEARAAYCCVVCAAMVAHGKKAADKAKVNPMADEAGVHDQNRGYRATYQHGTNTAHKRTCEKAGVPVPADCRPMTVCGKCGQPIVALRSTGWGPCAKAAKAHSVTCAGRPKAAKKAAPKKAPKAAKKAPKAGKKGRK